MRRRTTMAASVVCLAVGATGMPGQTAVDAATPSIHHLEGELQDGTDFAFDWPDNWNGTAFVDLDFFGSDRPETAWLLEHGFAVGGTERNTVGYRYAEAANNMVETLQLFEAEVGRPADTAVVWGRSRGSFVARKALELHPEVFDGAMAACGGGNGAIATFNQKIDALFALRQLLDVEGMESLILTGFEQTGPRSPLSQWLLLGDIVERARQSPAGRARLALAASFSQMAPWTDPDLGRPARDDWDLQIENIATVFAFAHPAVVFGTMELLAGGTVFWNTDVDYEELFAQSDRKGLVRAMYEQAGLDLGAELRALQEAPRISADPSAVDFVEEQGSYTGDIADPILTMHTVGDPVDSLAMERAYANTVRARGNNALLRQVVVDRPGHCNFESSEILAGLMTVADRIGDGRWTSSTRGRALNDRASGIDRDSDLELGDPDFVEVVMPQPLRTWDGRDWSSTP